MANPTAVLPIGIGGPDGVDNQLSVAVQESEKRNERGSAELSQQDVGARGVPFFCSGLLQHSEMDHHKVLIDDWLDRVGLDKTIEFMTPASP